MFTTHYLEVAEYDKKLIIFDLDGVLVDARELHYEALFCIVIY